MLFYSPFWGNDGRWLAWKIQVSYNKHSKGSISIISLIYSLLFCAASLPILCIKINSAARSYHWPLQKIPQHTIMPLVCHPKYCISIVFSFSWGHFNSQEELKTKLMQHFGVKMIFNYDANKTHFHDKGFALSLVLKVRFFGTWKWPIFIRIMGSSYYTLSCSKFSWIPHQFKEFGLDWWRSNNIWREQLGRKVYRRK